MTDSHIFRWRGKEFDGRKFSQVGMTHAQDQSCGVGFPGSGKIGSRRGWQLPLKPSRIDRCWQVELAAAMGSDRFTVPSPGMQIFSHTSQLTLADKFALAPVKSLGA